MSDWLWTPIEKSTPIKEIAGDGSLERQVAMSLLTRLRNTGTRDVYRRDLNSFMSWWQKDETRAGSPIGAERKDLDVYLTELDEADEPILSPATINRKIAVVSSFYEQACDAGLRHDNPALRLKRPKIDNEDSRTGLSAGQAGRLMKAADTWPDQQEGTLVLLLLAHGLRISEAIGLHKQDLQRDGGRLKLQVKRKGRAGKTPIVVDDPQLEERLTQLAAAANDNGALFGDISRFSAVRCVAEIGRSADVDPVPHPHLLRHTFVAQLLRLGTPIGEVRDLAGHSSISTTQRYASAVGKESATTGQDLRAHYESAAEAERLATEV